MFWLECKPIRITVPKYVGKYHTDIIVEKWLRWSRGSVLAFGTQLRGFKPGRSCRIFRHVKDPQSDMQVGTFGKILGHFSPIVPPSAAGFPSVTSDAGGLLWRKLECSKSLVLLQVGGLRCCWQRHSVKLSCWECSTTVEQAETQLRVVVPIEEDWRRRRLLLKRRCWDFSAFCWWSCVRMTSTVWF
jgi:hypothetical protein